MIAGLLAGQVATPSPIGPVVSGLFASVQQLFSNVIMVAAGGLVVIAQLYHAAVRWARKAVNAADPTFARDVARIERS